MHITNTVQGSTVGYAQHAALSFAEEPPVVHVGTTIDTLWQLADRLPGKQLPAVAYGAMPGEAVLATYTPGEGPGELLSFGASDHVILSLYDAQSGKSAIVHFDKNDQKHIDQVIAEVLEHVESANPRSKITASLFGGTWTTTLEDMGVKVRDGLVEKGITPTWHQWAFPMDREENHGVVLDLSNGNVTVFEHPLELADEFFGDSLRVGRTVTEEPQFLVRSVDGYSSGLGDSGGREGLEAELPLDVDQWSLSDLSDPFDVPSSRRSSVSDGSSSEGSIDQQPLFDVSELSDLPSSWFSERSEIDQYLSIDRMSRYKPEAEMFRLDWADNFVSSVSEAAGPADLAWQGLDVLVAPAEVRD